MAPADKARAAGVSASSFFELKAELVQREDEFSRTKAQSGGSGYVARPGKPAGGSKWGIARSNRGVQHRAARDTELEQASRATVESARAALERKAKVYDQLRQGKSGGLSEKQYESLLVDFDSQAPPASFDDDESWTVPRPPDDDDDPIIEYEDEFGRQRTAPRSEVPRHLLPSAANDEEVLDDDKDIIHNPVNFFPVYEPSAERVRAIQEAYSDANTPLTTHYDSTKEVRTKGAGFYQFSADEETRRQQMEELQSARTETEKVRQEAGAVDVRAGEVEGMRDDGTAARALRSRAVEKRKRELDERRKLLDAKRRK